MRSQAGIERVLAAVHVGSCSLRQFVLSSGIPDPPPLPPAWGSGVQARAAARAAEARAEAQVGPAPSLWEGFVYYPVSLNSQLPELYNLECSVLLGWRTPFRPYLPAVTKWLNLFNCEMHLHNHAMTLDTWVQSKQAETKMRAAAGAGGNNLTGEKKGAVERKGSE